MLCFLLVCSLHMERNVTVTNDWDMSGSGVVLQTGLVLTNYHMLGDHTYVNDEVSEVVKADEKLDLALLKVKTAKFSRLKFGKVKQGQAVHYTGNPGPLSNAVSRGWVVAFKDEYIITDTLPIPGMSGGALWDEHGHLAGLNVGYFVDVVGVHLAIHIPAEAVKRFLDHD